MSLVFQLPTGRGSSAPAGDTYLWLNPLGIFLAACQKKQDTELAVVPGKFMSSRVRLLTWPFSTSIEELAAQQRTATSLRRGDRMCAMSMLVWRSGHTWNVSPCVEERDESHTSTRPAATMWKFKSSTHTFWKIGVLFSSNMKVGFTIYKYLSTIVSSMLRFLHLYLLLLCKILWPVLRRRRLFLAVGCPDLKAPKGGRVGRKGANAEVRCNHSKEVWHVTCEGNTWRGIIGNCSRGKPCLVLLLITASLAAFPYNTMRKFNIYENLLLRIFLYIMFLYMMYTGPLVAGSIFSDHEGFPYGILIVVAIGVALGIFLGGLLLVLAIVYMKRFVSKTEFLWISYGIFIFPL